MLGRFKAPLFALLVTAAMCFVLVGQAEGELATGKMRFFGAVAQPLLDVLSLTGALALTIVVGIAVTLALVRSGARRARADAITPDQAASEGSSGVSGRRGRMITRAVDGEEPAPTASEERHALAAELIAGIIRDNAPPPTPDGPLTPEILAARARPIVMRESALEPDVAALSFYGGRPVAPAGFAWPRRGDDPAGPPLHFIMQWDCRALAAQDAIGLVPTDGVLLFFLDFEWGRDDGFRFVYCAGRTDDFAPCDPPADLGPVHGDQGAWQMVGCTPHVVDANRFVPRLMPHSPFAPIAFDFPWPENEDHVDAGLTRLFWNDSIHVREALLAIEGNDETGAGPRDISAPPTPFARPFAAFPHDFAAIRVLAVKAIKDCEGPYLKQRKSVLPDVPEEERAAIIARWLDQAKELYLFAAEQPIGGRVPQDLADQVWQWVADLEPVFGQGMDRLAVSAIDLSVGYGSSALGNVPEHWRAEAARLHALARVYLRDEHPDHTLPDANQRHEERKARGELRKVREVHAPTPTHMFGPPSYVQGYIEELIDDHLLLLEITSGSGPGHHFGDGVLQYVIRPDDLRERRFDQVRSVLSGY